MKHKRFSLQDLESSCASLSNLLKAGLSIRESVGRMQAISKKHASFWVYCQDEVSRGVPFSHCVKEVWPAELVGAVGAAERSANLQGIFEKQAEALRQKIETRKVFQKLISPAVSFLMGLGVFLFTMLEVIPAMSANLTQDGDDPGSAVRFSMVLRSIFYDNAFWVISASLILGYAAFHWLKDPSNQNKLLAWACKEPNFGEAHRLLTFSNAAKTMAALDLSGLPIKQQLSFTAQTVPGPYQEGFVKAAQEVEKRGRTDSVDPEKQDASDPRRAWPYFFSIGIMNSHETGVLQEEMERVSKILQDEGKRKMERFVAVVDLIAKIVAATMIAIPTLAYFSQLATTMAKAFA